MKFVWVEILAIKEPIPKIIEISSYCVLIVSFQKYICTHCVALFSGNVPLLNA